MFNRRDRPHSDFSEELQSHLALEVDRLRAEGFDEDQAYRKARRTLGNLETARERFYETGRWLSLENLLQDVRYALRRLQKTPLFVVTVILTLALGIGATTSIFTLVHAVLFRSLAVSNPEDLYRLGKQTHCCLWVGYSQDKEFSIVSYDLYKQFRDHTPGFVELAAFQAGQPPLGVRRTHSVELSQTYPGEFVSGNYFAMFGLNAAAGRLLTSSDDKLGATPVAVMSYRLWHWKYGQNPAIVGSIFNLNEKPFLIVGITPPNFYGDTLRSPQTDLYLPLASEPLVQGDSSLLSQENTHWLHLIGRLKRGMKPEPVAAQMRVELQGWLRSHWGEMDANTRASVPQQTVYLSPGGAGITSMREQYEEWLWILMTVSGFVLVIVCANVANLMLVRGMEQRQQTSLSMALGATASRIVRQALTEAVLLSILGGAAGLAIAFAGTNLILHLVFPTLPGLGSVPISASPSIPVLVFAFLISLLTGVIFGIAPAWLATKANPIEALRGANRSTNRAGSLPRKALVVLQASLSLVLLSASGLLTSALRQLETQDLGFDQDRRTVVNIDPSLASYKAEQLTSLYRRIHDSLARIPGVSSVALSLYSPQSGDSWNEAIFVDGHPPPAAQEDSMSSWNRVTAGFLETTGNKMIKGRTISDRDTASSRHVAVINEAFARKFFAGQDPIGMHFGRTDIGTAREYEVIGVAKNARYLPDDRSKSISASFFVPEPQYTIFPKMGDTQEDVRSHYLHDIVVVMKPGFTLAEVEVNRALAAVDPNLPVISIHSLREQVARQFSQQRLIASLTSLFGILSLVLATIGLYGVTAYNAARRTNEIGVRMAIGANRSQVVALVLRGAFALIVLGLLLGIPLTLAAGRLLDSQLYGISPYDSKSIVLAILALGSSALAAAFIPAFRAAQTSPLQALRAE